MSELTLEERIFEEVFLGFSTMKPAPRLRQEIIQRLAVLLREPGADTGTTGAGHDRLRTGNLWKRADELLVKLTAHCAGVDLPDEEEHRKAIEIIMDTLEDK